MQIPMAAKGMADIPFAGIRKIFEKAMFLSLQAFLNPGDEVLVPNPGYGQFYSCVKLKGPAECDTVDLFVRPGGCCRRSQRRSGLCGPDG